ncbi:Rv0340 family IniB-related protein [Mycolicibacterium sp. XJ870]
MANTLLDFVMSLVRDPEAAARYAADPAQAIAAADLTDVTSADVNNLIPVVSESLSMSAPTGGLDAFGAEPGGNVWASGAATAAFDAFGDHIPADVGQESIGQIIEQPQEAVSSGLEALADAGLTDGAFDEASLQISEPVIGEVPIEDPVIADDWAQPVVDETSHPDAAGFDIFD